MLRNKKKFVIYLCCALIWMGIIFLFSAQPSDVSSGTSLKFGKWIAEIVVPDFEMMSADEQIEIVEGWNFWIRKGAHFCEYAVLGILSTLTLWQTNLSQRKVLIASVIWCMLWAMGDEAHQLLVPGRSGNIRDVLIDTSGAFLGSLIMLICCALFLTKKDNLKMDNKKMQEIQ